MTLLTFTDAVAILNKVFIIDPALLFFNVVRALDMETKSNMLELVDATSSDAAQFSLKSAVLRRNITPSYWARERIFQDLLADG